MLGELPVIVRKNAHLHLLLKKVANLAGCILQLKKTQRCQLM